jgi:NADH-quinone oxidoreductase E subunit
MSIDALIAEEQPESFAFNAANEAEIKRILAKYPADRKASAVMPLLDLAQRQHDNWIPMAAIEDIASRLDMAKIRVLEVASFYTMFNLKPVGRYFLQLCGTTPCMLRGSDDVTRCIQNKLGISSGETTEDGQFSLLEVECLGACVNAPIIQVKIWIMTAQPACWMPWSLVSRLRRGPWPGGRDRNQQLGQPA